MRLSTPSRGMVCSTLIGLQTRATPTISDDALPRALCPWDSRCDWKLKPHLRTIHPGNTLPGALDADGSVYVNDNSLADTAVDSSYMLSRGSGLYLQAGR